LGLRHRSHRVARVRNSSASFRRAAIALARLLAAVPRLGRERKQPYLVLFEVPILENSLEHRRVATSADWELLFSVVCHHSDTKRRSSESIAVILSFECQISRATSVGRRADFTRIRTPRSCPSSVMSAARSGYLTEPTLPSRRASAGNPRLSRYIASIPSPPRFRRFPSFHPPEISIGNRITAPISISGCWLSPGMRVAN
jgi:hypothetical protein